MLAHAHVRLAAESGEVADRVRLIQASAWRASTALGGTRFAAVLCHGVIMCVDDPGPFAAALADLAQLGAIVSLVAKNAATLATRPALEGNWAEALAAFDTDRQVNGLGLDTRADTVEGLTAVLAESGVERIAWYGVRLFTDSWTPVHLGADTEDQALEVEFQASRIRKAGRCRSYRGRPHRHLSRLRRCRMGYQPM
jgi:hypothetical protein